MSPARPPNGPGWLGVVGPWLVLAGLCVSLNLPDSLKADIAPWRAFALHGELWMLLAVGVRLGRWTVPWLAALWTALLVVELDALLGVYLAGQELLLFDQIQLLSHGLRLAEDLGGAPALGGIGLLLVALGMLGVVAVRLFRVGLDAPGLRRVAPVLVLLGGAGALVGDGWPARWTATSLVPNVRTSVAVWSGLRQELGANPNDQWTGVVLPRRPDVHVYIVESYGRILAEHDDARAAWFAQLHDLDVQLGEGGWHAASGWLVAPVSGGRSWIADASLLSGMRIQSSAVYTHLAPTLSTRPSLPQSLAAAGYATVVVRPKDRQRPGLPLRDDFGWKHPVFSAEIDWTGPPWGWGEIPDQFSLGRLRDDVLPGIVGPRFVLFHGVSSHGPWRSVPAMVEDWRALPDVLEGAPGQESDSAPVDELLRQLRQYQRHEGKPVRDLVRSFDAAGARYQASVHYGLRATVDHLVRWAPDASAGDGAVVFVLGDHQPPILSRQDADGTLSFDVPLHVLATDPALLEPWVRWGFTAGMVPAIGPARLGHEDFYGAVMAAIVGEDQPVMGLDLAWQSGQ